MPCSLFFAGRGKDDAALRGAPLMFLAVRFVLSLAPLMGSYESSLRPRMKLFKGRVG